MKQITYTMHFRGQASRSSEDATVLRTTGSGTSCTLDTTVRATGVETTLHAKAGDLAFLESELRLHGQNTFDGTAVLAFGDDANHALRFSTIATGHLAPSAAPGVMAGAVSWKVDGGSGTFEGASGVITSAFTLTESGDLSEYHCGLIFVPE
jgi:hypothetical protein